MNPSWPLFNRQLVVKTLSQLIQSFLNLGFVNIDTDDYAGAVFFFGNFQVCLFQIIKQRVMQ